MYNAGRFISFTRTEAPIVEMQIHSEGACYARRNEIKTRIKFSCARARARRERASLRGRAEAKNKGVRPRGRQEIDIRAQERLG